MESKICVPETMHSEGRSEDNGCYEDKGLGESLVGPDSAVFKANVE